MPKSHRRAIPVRALLAAVVVAATGCESPKALVQLQQQLDEAADAVNDIRVNMSVMQDTIDSLRIVAAKQDSTIFRLANATGVQIIK